MKVSTQRLPESRVLLEIEVDQEHMERSLDRAYRKLVQQVEVPGFRKGKTPRAMLERYIGRARLLEEAIDIVIPEAYQKAIEEHNVEAIAEPSIELVSSEPLAFKATVPVWPEVELGDYRSIRVEPPSVEPDEEKVNEALEELRRRYALHEPVDRPVQPGDIVTAEVRIVVDGREVYEDEDAEFRLRDEGVLFLPGFREGVVGMAKGETREIQVTVPEGKGELAGKTGTATVTVKEIKEERLPELTDDFAQEVGEGFPSLEALRARIRSDLREKLEEAAEREFEEKAVRALVENAVKIEFPHVLVDREVSREIESQASRVGMDIERYLDLIKRTPQQAHDDLAPAAEERVRRSLALGKLAELEGITVEPAEIDKEVEEIISSAPEQAEQMRSFFAGPEARRAIERSLLSRKTLQRLKEIVSGGRVEAAGTDRAGAGEESSLKEAT